MFDGRWLRLSWNQDQFVRREAKEDVPVPWFVRSWFGEQRGVFREAVLITHEKSGKCRKLLFGHRLTARVLLSLLFAVVLGNWLNAVPAFADKASIEAFFGTYEGKASSRNDGEPDARDVRVSIQPHGSGFNVSWSTTKADGDRKAYSIDFETTKRPGIFGSAMRRNKFGDSVPLDPLQGDSYVWARITGQTLTVYGFVITPEGSYEMQVYQRTLSDEGLELEFFRYLEGEPVRLIEGTLYKVAD